MCTLLQEEANQNLINEANRLIDIYTGHKQSKIIMNNITYQQQQQMQQQIHQQQQQQQIDDDIEYEFLDELTPIK